MPCFQLGANLQVIRCPPPPSFPRNLWTQIGFSTQSVANCAWCVPSEVSVCTGEHEHTIVGYSLVKGIGDGEPIASERFIVGGHEWVRLPIWPGDFQSIRSHRTCTLTSPSLFMSLSAVFRHQRTLFGVAQILKYHYEGLKAYRSLE